MGQLEVICKPISKENEEVVRNLLLEDEWARIHSGIWKGFAAFYEAIPVGILLYQKKGTTLFLEHIFVKAGYRRHGVGTKMMNMLCQFADMSKLQLMFSFSAENHRDAFYRFLASTHVFLLQKQEGFACCFTEEELLAVSQNYPVNEKTKELFFEQGKLARKAFIDEISKQYPMVAVELEQNSKAYRKDLCCCVTERGEIQAACLIKEIQRNGKGELELKLLYGKADKGRLVAKAFLNTMGSFQRDNVRPLQMLPTTKVEVQIINKLFPQYEITKRFYIAYYMGNKKVV